MKTRPWTGKLNHDNSLSADWGCLRDDHGTPIAEVHVPIGNDDAESRRKNEDPTTERLSRIKDCCNACMEMDDPVKEIQELRAALSGRTVSCARCNEMAQQVPAIESLLMDRPWIGVDLDGTLAHYDEWRGIEHIGPPIEAMRLRVLQWLAEGQEVRILTARVGPQRHDVPHTIAEIRGHIEQWCLKHFDQVLPVTCQKDYCMVEFWDDRCVQVVPNTGRSLADELEAAHREAHALAVSLHKQHFAAVGHWEPLKEAAGLITQIDNMCAGLRSMKDDAVWAANQAQNAVAELNQRLIERQESFQAQLIRIEDGWREKLRESLAQVLALREALEMVLPMVLSYHQLSVEISVDDPALQFAYNRAVAALSTPPPPCVPLEDVRPLVDALISCKSGWSNGHDLAVEALDQIRAKHPSLA